MSKQESGKLSSWWNLLVSKLIIGSKQTATDLVNTDCIYKKYEVLGILGAGEFATVKLAKCRESGRLVAIKFIELEENILLGRSDAEVSSRRIRAEREIRIHSVPYIVIFALIAIETDASKYCSTPTVHPN